ncbi:MAG: hypothetical protein K1X61_04345 [Chitinophagales bacterium]|nr:hypothetical protein [Chitinophagales bacterium]
MIWLNVVPFRLPPSKEAMLLCRDMHDKKLEAGCVYSIVIRNPFGDRANIQTDELLIKLLVTLFRTTTDTASKADRRNNFIKKSPRSKILCLCTLHTFAFADYAQAHPEAKPKECNRQRFINFVRNSLLNRPLFLYLCVNYFKLEYQA